MCAVTVTLCNTIYPELSKSMLSLAQPCSAQRSSPPLLFPRVSELIFVGDTLYYKHYTWPTLN